MRDSENQKSDELPARAPLPESEKFFDPWEEEFPQKLHQGQQGLRFLI
ncbi:hypothetical protein J2W42_002026 [Rhizobium tibeticum]|nr:hypothetical protein [Rhizobium tibeticum]MDP9809178.1 hypothetical protein [Rhizobium tibeticum]